MIDAKKLRSFVDRLEALDHERSQLAADMSEVYKEARAGRLDPKIIKALIAERRRKSKDPDAFETASELLDEYRRALETPNVLDNAGQIRHARARVAKSDAAATAAAPASAGSGAGKGVVGSDTSSAACGGASNGASAGVDARQPGHAAEIDPGYAPTKSAAGAPAGNTGDGHRPAASSPAAEPDSTFPSEGKVPEIDGCGDGPAPNSALGGESTETCWAPSGEQTQDKGRQAGIKPGPSIQKSVLVFGALGQPISRNRPSSDKHFSYASDPSPDDDGMTPPTFLRRGARA